MRKLLNSTIVILVAATGLLVPLFLQPIAAYAATLNVNDVMSDSVFENVNSLSAAQIDAVANNYSSSCVSENNHFTTPDPLGYSSSQNKYAFGGNVSFGQAVYDIAKNYNVSPQVILTTLQKEQSVVTGSAGCYPTEPDPATAVNSPCGTAKAPCTLACTHAGGCMNIAMSYSCPNYCYAGIEGFSDQISGGTWLLRFAEMRAYGTLTGYAGYDQGDESYNYSGPMTPGYRQRVAGGPSIYYDGSWTTNDGTSVNITDGATASLYTYTPFVSGNQSFTNLFEDTFGFGSTTSGGCTGSETPLPYVVRYYNARTYEHFYTAYACDVNFLTGIGYRQEGPVFNTSPCDAGYATPVYRYYNPQTGQHMWDTQNLTQAQLDAGGSGYHVEAGRVFCVASPGMPGVHVVVRYYNPKTYLHIWAGDPTPADTQFLANQAGYTVLEGPAFYTQ